MKTDCIKPEALTLIDNTNIVIIAIGFLITILYRKLLSSDTVYWFEDKQGTKTTTAEEIVYSFIGNCVIYLMLPVHFVLSIFFLEAASLPIFAAAIIVGPLVSFSVFHFSELISKIGSRWIVGIEYAPFLSSSFGAGSRGFMILMVLLQLLAIPEKNHSLYINTFFIFDLAYFAFYIMYMQGHQMAKYANTKSQGDNKDKHLVVLIKLVAGFSLLKVVIVILGFDPIIQDLGQETMTTFRKPFIHSIVLFSSISVGLIVAFKKEYVFSFFKHLFYILGTRMPVFLGLGVILFYLMENDVLPFMSTTYKPMFLILFIFIVLPPSSYIDKFMTTNRAPQEKINEVATVNAMFTGLFFVILSWAAGLAFVQYKVPFFLGD